MNEILEAENSGYRFVAGRLTEITSPAEVAEVERVLENTLRTSLSTVHTQDGPLIAESEDCE